MAFPLSKDRYRLEDRNQSMDLTFLLITGLAVLVGYILFFSWRLQSRYGTLRPNGAVTRAYEHYHFDPDMVYYISGSDAYPRTLMGLDRRFVLASDFWRRKEFNPEILRETIRDMQAGALTSMQPLQGFDILDHQRQPVGILFSAIGVQTTIKMLPNNRIRVDTPPLPPETP
jgi:hypothetical protein